MSDGRLSARNTFASVCNVYQQLDVRISVYRLCRHCVLRRFHSTALHVPRVPLLARGITSGEGKFPSPKSALPNSHRSYGLMCQASSLFIPSPSAIRTKSLQVVSSPCWKVALPDVISAILTWSPGPIPRCALSVSVSIPFRGCQPIAYLLQARRTLLVPANATSRRGLFTGLQSFLYVQAPKFARPPSCTHSNRARRHVRTLLAVRPYTPRRTRLVTCPEQWYRYVPDLDNWHGGTCTHWTAALSAAQKVFNP